MTRAVRWLVRAVRLVRLVQLRATRRRPARLLLGVLSVAIGVALLVAVLIEARAFSLSSAELAGGLSAGADLQVVGPTTRGGVPDGIVRVVEGQRGVGSVVPAIHGVSYVTGGGGEGGERQPVVALGIPCTAGVLVGPLPGCEPGGRGRPRTVVSRRLDAGGGARLRTNRGWHALDDAVVAPELDGLNEGRVVLLDVATARHELRRPGYDTVYVDLEPGVAAAGVRARLAAAVAPGYRVVDGDRAPPGPDPAGLVLPLLAVFGILAAAVGGLLIHQTTALALLERRREIAVLGALGGTPGTSVLAFLGEAALVGALGGAVGSGLGVAVAHPLVDAASSLTERMLGLRLTVEHPPSVLLLGPVFGAVVAVVAAAGPARQAGRLSLVAELSGRERRDVQATPALVRRAALLTGAGLLGIGAVALGARGGGFRDWQPPLAQLGLLVTVMGLLLGAGAGTVALLAVLRARVVRGSVRRLALWSALAEPRRTSTIAVAGAAAVATGGVLSGLLLAIDQGSATYMRRIADDRLAVGTAGFTESGTVDAKPAPADAEALGEVEGVRAVHEALEIPVGYDQEHLVFVEAHERPTFPYTVIAGTADHATLARGETVVGATLARQRGLGVGDVLALPTRSGPRRFRVGGIWADPQGDGLTALLPYALAQELWGPQPPTLLFVDTGGRPTDGDARRIADAVGTPSGQDLDIVTPAGLGIEAADEIARYLRPLELLRVGLVLVAAASTAATLLLVGHSQRRERATMSALGLGSRAGRVVRVVEVSAVVTLGGLLGVVASVGVLEAVRRIALIEVGIHADRVVAGGPTLVVLVLVVAGAAVVAAVLDLLQPPRSIAADLHDE